MIYDYIRLISVASPGIEPGSGASETHILSIVLRGHINFRGAKVIIYSLRSLSVLYKRSILSDHLMPL